MVFTDHDMRVMALRNFGPISSKETYLQAVKNFCQDFRSVFPELWVKYLRNPVTKKPYGLVMVWKENDQVKVAGSIVHKNDKWNKHLALFYAANRINPAVIDKENGTFDPKKLPRSCFDVAAELVDKYLEKVA